MNIDFYLNTGLSLAFRKMFEKIEGDIDSDIKIQAYLAGGMAVHFYTGYRATGDVDVEFSHRIALPDDLIVEAALDDGTVRPLYIDKTYNSTFALMHPDYQEDAVDVPLNFKNFEVKVLNPTDIIVSKIARFAENDQEDIRQVLLLGLTTADQIEQRARESLDYYVGSTTYLKKNIEKVMDMSKVIQNKKFNI